MTNEDRKKTLALLALARKTFPSSKADGETLALYAMALDDLTYQQIKAGVVKLLNTATFFPTIAEIRKASGEMVRHVTKTEKPDAGEAWGEALKFIKARGPYDSRPFEFSCKEVEEAVERVGKTSLFALEMKDEPIVRAQFMKIYEKLLTSARDKEVMDVTTQKLGGDIGRLVGRVAEMKQIGG